MGSAGVNIAFVVVTSHCSSEKTSKFTKVFASIILINASHIDLHAMQTLVITAIKHPLTWLQLMCHHVHLQFSLRGTVFVSHCLLSFDGTVDGTVDGTADGTVQRMLQRLVSVAL